MIFPFYPGGSKTKVMSTDPKRQTQNSSPSKPVYDGGYHTVESALERDGKEIDGSNEKKR